MVEVDQYFKAVRSRVCSLCMDVNEDGECTTHGEELCSVKKFLPRIVKIVSTTESTILDDYLVQFRERICAICTPGGESECTSRDGYSCVLDRYYALIVETLQEARSRMAS